MDGIIIDFFPFKTGGQEVGIAVKEVNQVEMR